VTAELPEGVRAVADGVHMISHGGVNCYLVETGDRPVLVDGGLPGTWKLLVEALASQGFSPRDLDGVYLTHAHFDHVGLCRRLLDDHQTQTHVHEQDAALARRPYRYAHQSPRLRYPFRYPRAVPGLIRMAMAGALGVKGVPALPDMRPGEVLLRTGGLVPVFTPGHTFGHCAFVLPDRGVLFSGDALVTYDPYTGASGPRIVARAATADADAALASLDALEATQATLVLPGHGAPDVRGVERAVADARAVGVA
jgi:glyoxylase-like metal-dependent hydrolase (beta-lactamase superfamily II)